MAPGTYSTPFEGQSAYALFCKGRRFLDDGHPHQAAMILAQALLMMAS